MSVQQRIAILETRMLAMIKTHELPKMKTCIGCFNGNSDVDYIFISDNFECIVGYGLCGCLCGARACMCVTDRQTGRYIGGQIDIFF